MTRYVTVHPVLPGQSEKIREEYITQRDAKRSSYYSEPVQDYFRQTGIEQWEAWLQHLQGRDYLLMALETEDYHASWAALRRLIAEGHPIAMGAHERYWQQLGVDFNDASTVPSLEQVFHMEFPGKVDNEDVIGRSFAYPLHEECVEAHRRYSHKAMNALRGRTLINAMGFGIKRLTRWIQRSKEGFYVVFYMEKPKHCWEGDKERFHERLGAPGTREIMSIYEEHTGISPSEQYADVEVLWSAEIHEPACYA